ncbi:substrate-binding periplasmic protein [Paucibacter soli]|uniref:substrate-binding periplasmic protein n=1 Tax=Paucibacter soli TaxID=3133433 RepID=UPI0030AD7428
MALSGAAAQAQDVRLVYADYRPYSFLERGRAAGLEVAIADELFTRRLGLKAEHLILPWARAQAEVASGKADAFFAASTPERLEYAHRVGEPLLTSQVSAFMRQDVAPPPAGLSLTPTRLCAYRIGAVRGNSWVKTHLGCGDYSPASSTEGLVRMLMLARIDMVIEDRLVFLDATQRVQPDVQFREHALGFGSAPIYLLLGKRSALLPLLPRIEAALATMHKDGGLQAILLRHSAAP